MCCFQSDRDDVVSDRNNRNCWVKRNDALPNSKPATFRLPQECRHSTQMVPHHEKSHIPAVTSQNLHRLRTTRRRRAICLCNIPSSYKRRLVQRHLCTERLRSAMPLITPSSVYSIRRVMEVRSVCLILCHNL